MGWEQKVLGYNCADSASQKALLGRPWLSAEHLNPLLKAF